MCLTLKSDSCKKEEPRINNEKITGNVQKGLCVNGTSISIYDLNCSMGQTGNVFGTQITNNSGTFVQWNTI